MSIPVDTLLNICLDGKLRIKNSCIPFSLYFILKKTEKNVLNYRLIKNERYRKKCLSRSNDRNQKMIKAYLRERMNKKDTLPRK